MGKSSTKAQDSIRSSPAKLGAHTSSPPPSVWSKVKSNGFAIICILSLVLIGVRLYYVSENLYPLIFGKTESKGAVLSFKFDDDFDSLTDERKEAYLAEIAAAMGVPSIDLRAFRRGSVIVDINVDKETAERILREAATLGAQLDAEVSVSGSSPSRSSSHGYHSSGHASTHGSNPRDGGYSTSSSESPNLAYYSDMQYLDEGTLVLQSGDHVEIDRGLFALAQVSGMVFHDLNANGILDAHHENGHGEIGLEGVVVYFVRENGEVVSEKKTDRNGQYQFSEKEPGNYYVSIQLPPGYVLSPMPDPHIVSERYGHGNAGSLRNSGTNSFGRAIMKSNFEPTRAGNSTVFTLQSGSKATELNAALYRPGVVRGFAWEDVTGEGVFRGKAHYQVENSEVEASGEEESGERKAYALGHLAMADLVLQTDPELPVVASVALVANSPFVFDNVMPGTYKVRYSLPNDAHLVRASVAQPEFTLLSGQTQEVDVGYYRTVVIAGSIYEDLNARGFVTGKETEARRHIRGATIELVEETHEARENNRRLLEQRKGVSSAHVVSATGSFKFEGFAPGSYHLRFTPPAGYKRSMRLTPSELASIRIEDPEALPSDADPLSGITQSYLVRSGTVFKKGDGTQITACMYTVATIGGYVWNDANADGIFDEDESPLPDVEVRLSNADGTFQTTTYTNERGHYLFNNLEPGKYLHPVVIPPANHQHSNIRINFKYVDRSDRRLHE